MKKEYSWKVGSGFFDKYDANAVGKEIETLGKNVNPDNIIKLAKKKTSAMHDFFEWDDTEAAIKYRRHQAGILVSSLEVTFVSGKGATRPVTAYVSLKRNDNRKPIEEVAKDVELYSIMKERAFKELQAIKIKYANIAEIQEILADI